MSELSPETWENLTQLANRILQSTDLKSTSAVTVYEAYCQGMRDGMLTVCTILEETKEGITTTDSDSQLAKALLATCIDVLRAKAR